MISFLRIQKVLKVCIVMNYFERCSPTNIIISSCNYWIQRYLWMVTQLVTVWLILFTEQDRKTFPELQPPKSLYCRFNFKPPFLLYLIPWLFKFSGWYILLDWTAAENLESKFKVLISHQKSKQRDKKQG